MTRRFCLLAILLLAPVLLSPPASAQALTQQEIDRRFKMLDSNGDGRISKDEFELNKVYAFFTPLQRTSSGSAEVPGMIDRQVAVTRANSRLKPEVFDTLNVSGTGVLTGSEIIGSDMMRFENIDTNGDGYIDRAEFEAFIKKMFK